MRTWTDRRSIAWLPHRNAGACLRQLGSARHPRDDNPTVPSAESSQCTRVPASDWQASMTQTAHHLRVHLIQSTTLLPRSPLATPNSPHGIRIEARRELGRVKLALGSDIQAKSNSRVLGENKRTQLGAQGHALPFARIGYVPNLIYPNRPFSFHLLRSVLLTINPRGRFTKRSWRPTRYKDREQKKLDIESFSEEAGRREARAGEGRTPKIGPRATGEPTGDPPPGEGYWETARDRGLTRRTARMSSTWLP